MGTTYLIEKAVRTRIKSFKTSQAMYTFLNKGNNGNIWRVSSKENLKSGVYVFAGGQWHNVKSVDPSALAHM